MLQTGSKRTARTFVGARGNAQKTGLLVVVALAILGVAGVIGYQNLAERAKMAAHQSKVDEGNAWRQKVSQILSRSPDKFNAVNIIVGPDEWKAKVKVGAEVGGRVPNQAAMDELNRILTENPCPVPTEITVKVGGK
ncbi:MAG: hypothetical protein AB7K52_02645 [Phycisphaerales bacterium]